MIEIRMSAVDTISDAFKSIHKSNIEWLALMPATTIPCKLQAVSHRGIRNSSNGMSAGTQFMAFRKKTVFVVIFDIILQFSYHFRIISGIERSLTTTFAACEKRHAMAWSHCDASHPSINVNAKDDATISSRTY